MRPSLRSLVLAVGVLAFSACDSSGPPPGSFDITAEGAADASFSGEPATIVNDITTNVGAYRRYDFYFINEIVDGGALAPIVQIWAGPKDGVSLEEGEYPIGEPRNDPGPGQAVGTARLGEGLGESFFSRSGTLTLTEVTGDRVRGSFEFEGVGEFGDVTVRGTFDADLDAGFPR